MNHFLSTKKLKQISRGQLIGKYKITVLSYLIAYMFSYLILYFATSDANTTTLETLLNYAINFIVTLIGGIFTFGQCHLYLRISREDNCSIDDLWYGFKNFPDKAIGIQFVFSITELLCSIPLNVTYSLFATTKNVSYAIPLAVCLILYAVITIMVNLIFFQAFYLLNDHPDWKVSDLLKESSRLMKGHKFRLFYTHLSFCGVMLLGIISLGFGLFWVVCYNQMVSANFYENLNGNLKTEPTSINVTI